MSKAVMQQALEALETYATHRELPGPCPVREVEYALRQALAEPEQPHDLLCVCGAEWDIYSDGREELVAAPTPRKPLTDEEIALISGECAASAHRHDDLSFARAVIAAYEKKQGEQT